MSGKGSGRRPQKVNAQTFASNWERVFGKPKTPLTVTVPADLPAEDCWGVAERSIASSSNLDTGLCSDPASPDVGSNPTAPAIYVDDATGKPVG